MKMRDWREEMGKQYFSLLFPEKCEEYVNIQPVFFSDLQLEGVFKAIVSKYMEFDIRKYFYTIPGSVHTVQFRQDIYRDIEKNPSLTVALKQYMYRILESEKCFRFYRQMDEEVKKGSYLLLTCTNYLEALELLRDTLGRAELSSEGFSRLAGILEERFADKDFTTFEETVKNTFSFMEQLRLTLLVKNSKLSVLEENQEDTTGGIASRIHEFIKAFDINEGDKKEEEELVKHIFPSPLETSPLENTIVDILKKSRPHVFEMLKKFAAFDFTLDDDMFCRLKNEVLFYISFYEFEQKLNEVGYTLDFPEISENKELEAEGVYDVALAWKNRFSDYTVVKNDIHYFDGKSFLVITGPNQGGKTTLARAIGQSIYFMLIGLKAPCTRMRTRFFERILTHFEVEESVETGAGKLKEELQRLKPMMQNNSGSLENSFVILNELFTTATTYDAQIMAKKVLEHFIENHCLGIYVTHIQELADEKSQNGIQSMVAQVDSENPSVRLFKILPMEAEGAGHSDSIVKKYDLDFEHVTERIAGL